MDSAFAKNELRSVDPVWDRIREAAHAAAAAEPVLAGTLHATILSQPRFESALSYHLARLVGTTEVPAALIRQTFDEALAADPGIGVLVLAAGLGDKGPGPLVTHFAAHNRLHIMVTIVPGAMTDEEIVAVA